MSPTQIIISKFKIYCNIFEINLQYWMYNITIIRFAIIGESDMKHIIYIMQKGRSNGAERRTGKVFINGKNI